MAKLWILLSGLWLAPLVCLAAAPQDNAARLVGFDELQRRLR